jgi:hypothetical protein
MDRMYQEISEVAVGQGVALLYQPLDWIQYTQFFAFSSLATR